MIFFGVGPAEASFDGYGESCGACGVAVAFDGEAGGLYHGGTATSFVDMLVGAAKIKIYSCKAQRLECGGTFCEMLWVLAPDLGDDWRVGRGDLKAFQGVSAAFVGGIA